MAYVETICLFIGSAILFLLYLKRNRQYWSKKNVPSIKSSSIWGNIENPITSKKGLTSNIKDAYDEFRKQGHKHGGVHVLMDPVYMPIDPELVKHILSKDFQYFTGRGAGLVVEKEPLAANLFNLDGEEWRNLRVKFTQSFTSGKLKTMYPTLLECAVPMVKEIGQLIKNEKPIKLKDIISKFTIDVIGSIAFGIECNSFKDPDAEFRKHSLEITQPPLLRALAFLINFYIPRIQDWIYLKVVSKDLETFFINIVDNIVSYRENSNFKRNDFIQLLLEVNETAKANAEKPITLNEMAAHCFSFFTAGFHTSSTTIALCLHELAFNQKIQDKLREEIKETIQKNNGKLTYDGVTEMRYMDRVISETLRKYPVLSVMGRKCNKDYKVPSTDVIIERGTRIFISVLGLHRDEEYYPDPNKFDPERFSEENKATRHPFTYLPFGEGPRTCIGLRFALMQVKTGLSMILNSYKVLPGTDEPYEMEFEPKAIIISKKGDVVVNAVPIDS